MKTDHILDQANDFKVLVLDALDLSDLTDKVDFRCTNTRIARCFYMKSQQKAEIRIQSKEHLFHRGMYSTLCHELAHAIEFCIFGGSGHNKRFYNTLERVIKAWYTNPSDYNFRIEYRTIQKCAEKKGYYYEV